MLSGIKETSNNLELILPVFPRIETVGIRVHLGYTAFIIKYPYSTDLTILSFILRLFFTLNNHFLL